YDDNISPSTTTHVSDESYMIGPEISLVMTRTRLHLDSSYRGGYVFYQHHDFFNQADHDVRLGMEYRLSPHVMFSMKESFQKTSNSFGIDTATPNGGTNSGVISGPNRPVVPPVTDQVSNFANAEISYQFGPNAMIGAKGTFSKLWFPNDSQVSG